LSVAIPQFIRWMVDEGIAGGNLSLLTQAVLALLGLTLLRGLFTFFQGQWSEVASQSVAYDVRNDIERQLLALSFSYHDRTESGQLLSRALQDVEYIRFLTGRATLRIVDAVILFVATAVVLFTMNWQLALLAMTTLPLITVVGLRFGSRYRPLSLAIQQQLGVLTTQLEQNLRGARVVKAFAQEPAEIERFDAENEHWFALSARAARLDSLNSPLMDFIANAGLAGVVGLGGWLAIRGQITVGELIAFTTYLGQLADPVRRLGIIIPALAMASSSAERIFTILDTQPDVASPPSPKRLSGVRGEVAFQNVSFAYDGSGPVLQNLTFTAKPGQIIALLGATGSGKTTVINLIPRLYDPTAGCVTLDGQDLRALPLDELRQQIGIVLQETMLFAASVRENIAYGRPDASEEEIIAAAKAAQAHDFIVGQLADGYDTVIGEKGTTLSGGQKQRLAIARALLTDPRILILDDATAAVDVETERRIQTALDTLMQGRTTFVIAHRLSTVRRADLILLLDEGRIAARGSHDELLVQSPLYREVYERQLE
ncbi:MAG: ABC transporter ATP-binding protein, partial [Chloroflexi bacterium]|nr:ABC transporter ATP-binding protein [Chloroflexota bacterium]